MLEEIQALALLGLIAGHFLLIKGCHSIHDSMEENGDGIQGKIEATTTLLETTTTLLDEAIQLIVDLTDNSAETGIAHTPSSPFEMLTALVLNKVQGNQNHGDPKNEIWTIQEENSNTTQEIQAEI